MYELEGVGSGKTLCSMILVSARRMRNEAVSISAHREQYHRLGNLTDDEREADATKDIQRCRNKVADAIGAPTVLFRRDVRHHEPKLQCRGNDVTLALRGAHVTRDGTATEWCGLTHCPREHLHCVEWLRNFRGGRRMNKLLGRVTRCDLTPVYSRSIVFGTLSRRQGVCQANPSTLELQPW